MNEPIRGGEPEVAVNPRNPNDLVLGHTVVGNTYANNTTEAGEEAANGGLQVSQNGGKTWTADRPLHTSGFTDASDPYLIANGFPTATGYTSTTNGVGDPIEASGPDGSLYAGGVLAHTTPGGPPPFNFTVPQGGDRGGPVEQRRSHLRSDHCSLDRPGSPGDGQPRDDPEGNPEVRGDPVRPAVDRGRPVDRCGLRVDDGHPQRYVAVSHDKARTWGRVQALDCDEATPPDANHDVTCANVSRNRRRQHRRRARCPRGRVHLQRRPRQHLPLRGVRNEHGCRSPLEHATSSLPAYRARQASSSPPIRRRKVASRCCSCRGIRSRAVSQAFPVSKNIPQEVQVFTTGDSGSTWSTPTTLGNESAQHITNRPWISYGPTGVLAALWRNAYPPYNAQSFLVPGTQNVFAAVARNNGSTFSAPVQLDSGAVTASRSQATCRGRRVMGRGDETVRLRRMG